MKIGIISDTHNLLRPEVTRYLQDYGHILHGGDISSQSKCKWASLPGSSAEIPVCSGDMLFNLFDEFIGFLR